MEKLENERREIILRNLYNNKKILEKNRETFKEFFAYLDFKGLSNHTIISYVSSLKFMAYNIRVPFKEARKEHLKEYLYSLKTKKSSQKITRIHVRKFFQWLYEMKKTYPEPVDWIEVGNTSSKQKLPEDLPTPEDITKIICACDSLRDKALISILYDSGARAGEIAGLRIKDIEFDEYGAKIMVNGKTGMRKIRLIDSVPDLKNLVNNHPYKDSPDIPLFLNIAKKKEKQGISVHSIYRVLQLATERTDIKKHMHPHALRHAKLTELAKQGFTDSQMRIIAGWEKGSVMPRIYVHLSGADVDNEILRKAGLLKDVKDENKINLMKPKICFRCQHPNPFSNKLCDKCSQPLDMKHLLDMENRNQHYNEILDLIMSDKEIQDRIVQMKSEDVNLNEKAKELVKILN